jgi:TIR domain
MVGDPEPKRSSPDLEGALQVFISYRRADAADAAGRLHDALTTRFGDNVFMDVDDTEPGQEYPEVLNNAVASCDVLVAMIGREWLTARDDKGQRRLDQPEDWVRLEIEAALKRDLRVIPVLLHGVSMPVSDELPNSLASLARREALEIDHSRWRDDVRRLIQTLERLESEKAEKLQAQAVRARGEQERQAQSIGERAEPVATERAEREARERMRSILESGGNLTVQPPDALGNALDAALLGSVQEGEEVVDTAQGTQGELRAVLGITDRGVPIAADHPIFSLALRGRKLLVERYKYSNISQVSVSQHGLFWARISFQFTTEEEETKTVEFGLSVVANPDRLALEIRKRTPL